MVLHHITPAGLEKLSELEAPLTRVFDRIVTALGPAKAEAVVEACERAIDAAAAVSVDEELG